LSEPNPMVPIVADRLRAALSWRDLTVTGLAALAGENQQTVDAISRGVTARCRADRRRRLSEVLGCPDEWLGGEAELDGIPPWDAGDQEGQSLIVDEAGQLHQLDPSGQVQGELGAAYQLAWWDFARRIVEAWERDISEGDERAAAAHQGLLREGLSEWWFVRTAVQGLLSGYNWRKFFFRGHSGVPVFRSVTREELQEQRNAVDDFARLQGQALNRLFEPWFLGTAKMNYEVLVETLEWTMRDMMKQGFAKWKSELLEMMLDPED